jgi:hypothetical protein
MLRRFRPRLTYANVAATLALVLAMSGGAVAATHYLITSSKQISPKVLKELKKPGAQGATGPAGATGSAGAAGTNGTNGALGPEGKQGQQGVQGPEGKLAGNTPRWHATSEAGASAAAPVKTTLLEAAPFKVVGHCFKKEGNTVALTFLTLTAGTGFVSESNEAEGSEIKALEEKPLTSEAAEETTAEPEAVYIGPSEGLFSAYVPSGEHSIDGAANDGVFLEGKAKPACYFSGFAVAG